MNSDYINNENDFLNFLNETFEEHGRRLENDKNFISDDNLVFMPILDQYFHYNDDKINLECNTCLNKTYCLKCLHCSYYYCYFCFKRTFTEFDKCSQCCVQLDKNAIINYINNRKEKLEQNINKLEIATHSLCLEINKFRNNNEIIKNKNKRFLYGIYDFTNEKLLFHNEIESDNILQIKYPEVTYQVQMFIRTLLKNILEYDLKTKQNYWNKVIKIIKETLKLNQNDTEELFKNLTNIKKIINS